MKITDSFSRPVVRQPMTRPRVSADTIRRAMADDLDIEAAAPPVTRQDPPSGYPVSGEGLPGTGGPAKMAQANPMDPAQDPVDEAQEQAQPPEAAPPGGAPASPSPSGPGGMKAPGPGAPGAMPGAAPAAAPKKNPVRTQETWGADGKFSREVEADGVDDLVQLHQQLNQMGLTKSDVPQGAQPAAPAPQGDPAAQSMPQEGQAWTGIPSAPMQAAASMRTLLAQSGGWWDKMSPEQQKKYKEKHPKSKQSPSGGPGKEGPSETSLPEKSGPGFESLTKPGPEAPDADWYEKNHPSYGDPQGDPSAFDEVPAEEPSSAASLPPIDPEKATPEEGKKFLTDAFSSIGATVKPAVDSYTGKQGAGLEVTLPGGFSEKWVWSPGYGPMQTEHSQSRAPYEAREQYEALTDKLYSLRPGKGASMTAQIDAEPDEFDSWLNDLDAPDQEPSENGGEEKVAAWYDKIKNEKFKMKMQEAAEGKAKNKPATDRDKSLEVGKGVLASYARDLTAGMEEDELERAEWSDDKPLGSPVSPSERMPEDELFENESTWGGTEEKTDLHSNPKGKSARIFRAIANRYAQMAMDPEDVTCTDCGNEDWQNLSVCNDCGDTVCTDNCPAPHKEYCNPNTPPNLMPLSQWMQSKGIGAQPMSPEPEPVEGSGYGMTAQDEDDGTCPTCGHPLEMTSPQGDDLGGGKDCTNPKCSTSPMYDPYREGSKKHAQAEGMPPAPAAAAMNFEHSNERSDGDRVVWDVSWNSEDFPGAGEAQMKQYLRSYVQRDATNLQSKNWGFTADCVVEDLDVEAGIATVTFQTSEQAAPQVAPAEATE